MQRFQLGDFFLCSLPSCHSKKHNRQAWPCVPKNFTPKLPNIRKHYQLHPQFWRIPSGDDHIVTVHIGANYHPLIPFGHWGWLFWGYPNLGVIQHDQLQWWGIFQQAMFGYWRYFNLHSIDIPFIFPFWQLCNFFWIYMNLHHLWLIIMFSPLKSDDAMVNPHGYDPWPLTVFFWLQACVYFSGL